VSGAHERRATTRGSAVVRAAALTAAVLAADQGTKALARGALARGERDPILPGVTLVNVRNDGIAFGLFDDGGVFLIVFALAAVAALLAFFVIHARRRLAWLPTGLLLGGAAGNLIDRARDGAVTDFIDLPLWPAFNLADVAIVAGVISLLWVLEGPPRAEDPDRA
jgi:signal peptidase II